MSSEDVLVRWIYSFWSRRLKDVLETSSEDEDERRLQDVFKTSSLKGIFPGIMFKIPTLEPKKHEKVNVVFDEGLQRICYNELEDLVEIAKIFICFCKNEICWEQEQVTLERQQQ